MSVREDDKTIPVVASATEKANIKAQEWVLKNELPRATPTIQKAVDKLKDTYSITNICASYSGVKSIEHEACAAIDVVKTGIPQNQKEKIESLDLVCESHFNYSGTISPDDDMDSHWHCRDRYWLEEYRFKKAHSVNKQNTNDSVSEILTHAFFISGEDKDFIRLLIAENGTVDPHRVGITGDLGLCQIAPQFHPKITNDTRFGDWKWQLDQCYKLYKGGTTFWGYERIKNEPDYKAQVDSLLTYS